MTGVFKIILVLIVLDYILDLWLGWRNNRARKNPVPADLSDVYDDERYKKYVAYKAQNYRLSLITGFLTFAGSLVMLFAGFSWLDGWLRGFTENPVWLGLLFFGIIGLVADLLATPFDAYETFVIEQKYGFNNTTVKTYISDKLKSWALGLVIGGGMLALIIWLYQVLGSNFWWLAWLVFTVFSLIMTFFYSSVIVPLFNKQEPLQEGSLRDKLVEVAGKTGFRTNDIYVIDGSRRSTRANAYFTGFGKKKRIVLYDTLIKDFNEDEIASVLAHEIGHYRLKHILKGTVLSILQMGLMLFLFSLIIDSPWVYRALGVENGSFHIALVVFVLLYSPFSTLLAILGNKLSRNFEFAADAFSANVVDCSFLIRSLKKLSSHNLSDLSPDRLFAFIHYSHPTLAERIGALKSKVRGGSAN